MDFIMKSREMRFSIFTFFSFILIAYASICVGEVLFEDDFEGGTIDQKKWNPAPTWVVDKGVLGANGGEIGITVKNDFTDFEFYADFNMLSANKFAPNFVLRAKDKDNCTLVQIVADARNQLWWFMRVGGNFKVDAKNFLANESGVQPELERWYSIKLVAEGNRYELHLGKQGEELKLACKWTDKTHKRGGIGFREGNGEHCLYDNILVTTVGHSFAVNPHNSLPTVWGRIKGGE